MTTATLHFDHDDTPTGDFLQVGERRVITARFASGVSIIFSGFDSSQSIAAARAVAKELTDAADKAESHE